MKLQAIPLCLLLLTPSATTSNADDLHKNKVKEPCYEQCDMDISNIYRLYYDRIYRPDYLSIYNLTKEPNSNLPITKGVRELYSTTPKGIINLRNKKANSPQMSRIFLGFSTLLSLDDPSIESFGIDIVQAKEMGITYIYISPILDRTHNYVSGFVVAGYKENININYRFNTSFELLNIHLSSILENCL